MAVTFDATGQGSTAAEGLSIPDFTLTIGAGVTDGCVLVSVVFEQNTVSGVTVTVGGSAATLVAGTDTGTTQPFRSMIFRLATGNSTGAKTISISWTTVSSACGGAISFSGVNQTTPTNNGTNEITDLGAGGGTAKVTVTSVNGDLTYSGNTNNFGTRATAPTQTLRFDFTSVDLQLSLNGSTGPGTGTATHTWTYGAFAQTSNSGCNLVAAAAAAGQPMAKRWGGVPFAGPRPRGVW